MQLVQHKVAAFAKRWAQATKQRATDPTQQIIRAGNCVQDPHTNKYVIAPAVVGRIVALGEQQQQQQQK